MSPCPKCASHNDDEAHFCAACGADLQPVPVAAPVGAYAAATPAVTQEWPAIPVPEPLTTTAPYVPEASYGMTAAPAGPVAPAEQPKRRRSWIPVVAAGLCGLIAAIVFLMLWIGARGDADTKSKQLASTRSTLDVTKRSLAASKHSNTLLNGAVARERASLASANHDLADAQQRANGLKNSVDLYKKCGSDLGKFFQALETNDRAGATSTLFEAKLDCDKIDPTIIPLTP